MISYTWTSTVVARDASTPAAGGLAVALVSSQTIDVVIHTRSNGEQELEFVGYLASANFEGRGKISLHGIARTPNKDEIKIGPYDEDVENTLYRRSEKVTLSVPLKAGDVVAVTMTGNPD